jgi:hypothetical protein
MTDRVTRSRFEVYGVRKLFFDERERMVKVEYTVQSLFFSPNKSQPFIWGLGPALLTPTATDDLLGLKKFGLGPTLVVLKQHQGWTVDTLMNHIWSVAGSDT